MVIDTSAIVAILFDEPERSRFIHQIKIAEKRLISASTLLECEIVVQARKGISGRNQLELFIHEAQIIVVPFDQAQVNLAIRAWQEYGKGQHPAGLNFGDCFSYALAKATGEPLLFKGVDFVQTDITSC